MEKFIAERKRLCNFETSEKILKKYFPEKNSERRQKFSNDGKSFISSGFDRHINYWEVFGECLNYHQISHAHKVH